MSCHLWELPFILEEKLIADFCDDLENHSDQRQDENSSDGSTVIKPYRSKQSSTEIQPVNSRHSDKQETSVKIQKELEDDNKLYQSFNKIIYQSTYSEISSPNRSFKIDGLEQDAITNVLQDTLVEEQSTSAASTASCKLEKEIEAEPEHRPEAEPEHRLKTEPERNWFRLIQEK